MAILRVRCRSDKKAFTELLFRMAMPIYTVLGPIAPTELGTTSMHEHLLIDGRVWFEPAREPLPEPPTVSIENLGFVHWNLVSLEDNLVIDDVDLAVHELNYLATIPNAGLVDLTNIGLGRRIGDLAAISERSGVHVMSGCGFYVHDSHPDFVEQWSIDQLAELLISELRDGVENSGIKAALIGEIGTSSPVTQREKKVLAAAGTAAVETQASVSIHLEPRGAEALVVLDVLLAQGISPDRVIMGHLDEHLDKGYHAEVAQSGVAMAFDTFGSDFYFSGLFKDPTDLERIDHLMPLLGEGHAEQLVLACDVWTKANLKSYGGFGYDHLHRRILPLLRDQYGVADEIITQMMVENPRRLLDRP
ncbi:phosphotriesterase family protein [Mycolicibacterium senegalense]|nr:MULTISPECIES: phosphotriesterase [Mycolicibacterium]